MEYSIVIPAYNESDKISATITQVISFMRTYAKSFEVIVVDDGSRDDTVEAAKTMIEGNPELIIVENPHKGKGPSVWTGMMKAKGDLIYMCDADLSSPISEIKKLVVWIKDQGYDVAIASREGVGAKRIGEPIHRHIMGRVFNFMVQAITLPGISDSQCGFKLFTNKCAKDVFGRMTLYGENAKEIKKAYTGAFDVEALFLARKLGYKIKSVPVTWTYVKTTRVSPITDSVKMALDIFKIRVNFLRGKYPSAQKTSTPEKTK